MSFSGKLMELKIIIWSEIIQAQKDKYVFCHTLDIDFLEGIKEGRNQTILEEEEDKSERRMRHEYGVVFKVHYICAQKCNTDVYICIINTC